MARRPRLAVLGSLNMDISVTVPRLPGPGETILGSGAVIAPGGKGANQAVAAARLGADVRMIGCTGDDEFGQMARAALLAEEIDLAGVRTIEGCATGIALITVDGSGENVITVAPGANALVDDTDGAMAAWAPDDLLVLSAEIPVNILARVVSSARVRETRCVLNLAPAPPGPADAHGLLADGVDWLVVNESEAAAVLGHDLEGLAGASAAADELCALGARTAVVTAGSRGAALAGDGGSGATAGFRVRSLDSVGAGDAFVGALSVALAAGLPGIDAVRAACAAGATATTRRGTQDALPRPADILAATGYPWPLRACLRT